MKRPLVWLAWLVGGLLLLFILSLGSGRPVSDPLTRPSTFFTDPTGTRAAFLLLREVLGSDAAQQLREPLWTLGSPQAGPGTLIVTAPSKELLIAEANALDEWLERGGQLLILQDQSWLSEAQTPYLASHGLTFDWESTEPRTVQVDSNGLSLYLRGRADWSGEYEVVTHTNDEEIAVAVKVGEGRIVALADPSLLSNRSLGEADNGVWLVHLVRDWGNGRAWFDEHHLGMGESPGLVKISGRFLTSPWGLPFLQLGCAGLLLLLVQHRRIGRAVLEEVSELPDPTLLLKARSGLFEAASAGSMAIDRMCHELSYQLKSSTGRPASLEKMAETQEKVKELLRLRERALEGHVNGQDVLRAGRLICEIRKDNQSGT
jgi:Domain of unknown function (DUF4350)